jgi:hypothetical protein
VLLIVEASGTCNYHWGFKNLIQGWTNILVLRAAQKFRCQELQNIKNIHKPRIITATNTRHHHEFSTCHDDPVSGICPTLG